MIKWILKELEKNPAGVFLKKDLVEQSKEQFEVLKKLKLLTYIQLDLDCETYPCSLPCSKTCPMDIVGNSNELFAICPKNSDIDPIPLIRDDLDKYQFCTRQFLERIRSANNISGSIQEIKPNYFHFGYITYNNLRIGFIFGFNITSKSALELTGMKNLCIDDDSLVIFSPFSVIEDTAFKKTLSSESMRQFSLAELLEFVTFRLSIDKVIPGILKLIEKKEHKYNTGRKKRGRKKDPKIKTRNRKIAEFKADNPTLTYKEIGQKFDVSADVARKACNNTDN